MIRWLKPTMLLLPALIAYGLLAQYFDFIQDDAYITYRYVANFLNGDGLVYNVGERIEGFTNFGWTIILAMYGSWGGDFIGLSQILGFLFGAGVVVVTFLVARQVFSQYSLILQAAPAYLAGFNMSLAYWSPAGLETAAFAFFAMLSFYLFMRRNRLLVWSLLMAVWIRPEGGLVALILLIVETVQERRLPRFSFLCGLVAFVLSLPMVGFKLMYYGSILPNPFFAKTGADLTQITSGAEYVWRFLSHYGLWGVFLVVPVVLWWRLNRGERTVWLIVASYTLYIVLVGGDVLKVHRFFLPLIGLHAVLAILSMRHLTALVMKRGGQRAVVFLSLPLIALSFYMPYDFVQTYNEHERLFTQKMATLARNLKAADDLPFSVALPTIGAFGYELMGHEIIDMLGLTDSTIARHPEEPVAGMETTWKELSHNSTYLLKRAPDYIMFSTSYKPSAPAEKALFLYSEFTESYRTIGWPIASRPGGKAKLTSVFCRVRPVQGDFRTDHNLEFVDNYVRGAELISAGKYDSAVVYCDRAIRSGGQPLYPYAVYIKASSHMMMQEHEITIRLLDYILARDSLVFEAHRDLYTYSILQGQPEKAAIHERWLVELVPWYVDNIKETTRRLMEGNR